MRPFWSHCTALVRPTLEYAASIWDPSTKKNITKLEKVQRSAARFVCSDYSNFSSVTSMLDKLEWPPLQDRRKCARLTNLFKIQNGELQVAAAKTRLQPTRSTRLHSARLRQLPSKSEIYKNSFSPKQLSTGMPCPPLSSTLLLHPHLRKD